MAGHLILTIIKPRLHKERRIGELISFIEKAEFSILLCKLIQIRKEGAEQFYIEQKTEANYSELVSSVLTGPSWVLVLGKPNAVEELHKTLEVIPKELGDNIHISAHDWAAKREINFFFNRELRVAQEIDNLEKK